MAKRWAPEMTAAECGLQNFRIRGDYFQNWRVRVDDLLTSMLTTISSKSTSATNFRMIDVTVELMRTGGAVATAGESEAIDCLYSAADFVGPRPVRGQAAVDRITWTWSPVYGTGKKSARRRGLTLAELLVASTIMLMIAAAVATLAIGRSLDERLLPRLYDLWATRARCAEPY